MADNKKAERDEDSPEDSVPEEPRQDIEETKEPAAEPAAVASSPSAISLPIEGESKWVNLMRLLAGSIFGVILVMGGVFHFLTDGDSFIESNQLAMIMGGIVFLLVLEYFIFLLIVIPRQADYGRYVIHHDKVDFYPLSGLGLGISGKSSSVRIGRYVGVMTGRTTNKKGKTEFAVYLVHVENKGKTINVRSFANLKEAEHFAAKLGELLNLKAVSGTHRPAKQ